MSEAADRWAARWDALVPGHPDIGAELVRCYADPSRKYHNLDHLQTVLETVRALRDEAAEPRLVMLAAWYHDAVYDVGRDDNEERSAALATRTLSAAGLSSSDVAEVARLVRLTTSHDPARGDANGAVLCDADLVVLARPEREYAAYVAAVRAEYAQVGDQDFRSGRAAVLAGLLRLPTLYRTTHGSATWEEAARRNLSRELDGLRVASEAP
jgi:predicted metal-dependent HD superfamily phosphohydrolase